MVKENERQQQLRSTAAGMFMGWVARRPARFGRAWTLKSDPINKWAPLGYSGRKPKSARIYFTLS